MACVTVISVSGLLRMSPEGYKAEQSRRTVTQLNFGITLFMMMIYVASGIISLVWNFIRPNILVSSVGIIVPCVLAIIFSYSHFKKYQN